MPDFTVIEGGGDKNRAERDIVRQDFEVFVVALLRNLANGDAAYETTEAFFHFLGHAQETEVPIGPIFDLAIKNLHKLAFDPDRIDEYERERRDLTRAALRVVVESTSVDGFAGARLSKRREALDDAVDTHILGLERRSRENGWSYAQNLLQPLGKWPRKK